MEKNVPEQNCNSHVSDALNWDEAKQNLEN
jgi:hypothetical protein